MYEVRGTYLIVTYVYFCTCTLYLVHVVHTTTHGVYSPLLYLYRTLSLLSRFFLLVVEYMSTHLFSTGIQITIAKNK